MNDERLGRHKTLNAQHRNRGSLVKSFKHRQQPRPQEPHGYKPEMDLGWQEPLICKKLKNQALRIVVSAGALVLIIWGGAVGLTAILDYYGFGPNTQTQQDRIEQNLRRLKGQRSDQPFQPNANQ